MFNNNHKPKTYSILVYYQVQIIVMKLLKIKLNAKIDQKTKQINYCLYRPLNSKNLTLAQRARYGQGSDLPHVHSSSNSVPVH